MPDITPASPIIWDDAGLPRSRLYGDVYFSGDDGLAEKQAVFLQGCDLPAAWRDRRSFVVAELGFGAGLNTAALIDLWRRERPPDGHLFVFSVEAHPMSPAEAGRILGRWPALAPVAGALLAQWPGVARGFHRAALREWGVTLDVAIMEAAAAVEAWSGAADAWFLDGFSPALNPAMWAPAMLALIARRSAPGARLASYSVAGAVRRDLAEAGFAVERRPGHGAKRHRLEARLPGAPPPLKPPRVVIVGAGIAGAALARAFDDLGLEARVLADPAASALLAPAALVAPRLDAGLAAPAALFAQAMARAGALYDVTPDAVIARGADQLAIADKDPGRFAAIAGSDLFEPGAIVQGDGRLGLETARVIDPGAVTAAWLGGRVEAATVAALTPGDGGWRIVDGDGTVLAEAEVVCLAAAMGVARLVAGTPLAPVRGQASVAPGATLDRAQVFGGYAVPTRDGVLFGATHDRGDQDPSPRAADHARNLQLLEARLPALAAAAAFADTGLRAHSGVRATTGDFLPLAGAVEGAPGLFLLTGLGSRGFTLAPLLAEHVAARATGAPSPLPREIADLVDPARFAARARRRGRP